MTVSKERVEGLIKTILEKREENKDIKAYITGAKEEIGQFMEENDLTEYKCQYGIVKIADSVRESIDKVKVEAEVTKVNSKEIDHIEMKDLYKHIDVHSISIKPVKED
ncbi:MAG: hypothetical protein ACI4WU_04940 [Bacilli bacterium]